MLEETITCCHIPKAPNQDTDRPKYPLPKFINNLRKHPHPVTIKYAFAHLQQLQKSEN